MQFSHYHPIFSAIVISVCLSMMGCTKTTNSQVNNAIEPVITSDDKPEPVEVTKAETGAVKFEGTLDEDSNGIELLKACNSSHVDIQKIEHLISTGVDLNKAYQIDNYTYTPLDVLCSQNDIDEEAIRLLVKHGADINASNDLGLTPMMIACDRKDIDIPALKTLIELGADLNAKDSHNITPLFYLVRNHDDVSEAVTLLLDAGADIHYKISDILTPLFFARHQNVAKLLIERGIDVYANDNGLNALYTAALYNNLEVVKILVEKGLDPSAISGRGQTPLMFAGSIEVAKYLMDHGAVISNNQVTGTAFMSTFLSNFRHLLRSNAFGSEVPLTDDEIRNFSRLTIFFLEQGAEKDEYSSSFRELANVLKFDNEADYKKLYHLYINKNTGLDAKSIHYILYDTLSSMEYPGFKLTPDFDTVKELIDLLEKSQNPVRINAVLAYFENDKVVHDPQIIEMLFNHSEFGKGSLSFYLSVHEITDNYDYNTNPVPKPKVIHELLDYGVEVDRSALTKYLTTPNHIPDIEVVERLLSSKTSNNLVLLEYLTRREVVPQNPIIEALLDAKIPMYGDELYYYLAHPSIEFNKETANKLFASYSDSNHDIDLSTTFSFTEKNCKKAMPFILLIAEKMPELLIKIDESEYDPNSFVTSTCQYDDETPLMTVVSNPDLVQMLIDAGADVNAVTSKGETALSRAIKGGFTKSIDLLKQAGAVANIPKQNKPE